MTGLSDTALVVIDVQNDFCPGGALPVPGGDEIVSGVNDLLQQHSIKILTQDWHPMGHGSFASSHSGKAPFETAEMSYGPQVLWPDHCVQGQAGAEFHPELDSDSADLIIRKGFRPEVDSYSAFFENDRTTPTGLEGYLRTRGVEKLLLVGLATDFCVAYSALDGARLGFDVTVDTALCRAIDMEQSLANALDQMKKAGVTIL
ncbi:bifunctional nicotinamidase/pyrazinamidase [Aliiroseovarius crassostreae]|uniref:bifunctional nicotinamidase/pyrazinamidase n=1 Tax=Aliiroseovarius crassostreae TaxID=154981 RepID=UPI003C7A1764